MGTIEPTTQEDFTEEQKDTFSRLYHLSDDAQHLCKLFWLLLNIVALVSELPRIQDLSSEL